MVLYSNCRRICESGAKMINLKEFKKVLKQNNSSINKIADELSVNRSTIYRKLQNNGESFTIKEINLIVHKLNLTQEDIINIFFAINVA